MSKVSSKVQSVHRCTRVQNPGFWDFFLREGPVGRAFVKREGRKGFGFAIFLENNFYFKRKF